MVLTQSIDLIKFFSSWQLVNIINTYNATFLSCLIIFPSPSSPIIFSFTSCRRNLANISKIYLQIRIYLKNISLLCNFTYINQIMLNSFLIFYSQCYVFKQNTRYHHCIWTYILLLILFMMTAQFSPNSATTEKQRTYSGTRWGLYIKAKPCNTYLIS